MKNSLRPAAALLGAAALVPLAAAQTSVEGFDTGANPDSWEAWFSAYNTVPATGGNPGGHLELDNFTSGPATCHFVDIAPEDGPGVLPHAHSGDWRAALVDEVSIDLDIEQGLYNGDLVLELVSDPGTPGNDLDDCIVRTRMLSVAGGPGWATYTFVIPSQDTNLPAGWETDGPCVGSAAWNQVMADVDQMRFSYDANPPAFCIFTNWLMRIDNITVGPVGPASFGTNYCTAVANSTGAAAAISGIGSTQASRNDVTLNCAQMPPNQFGIFLTSTTQASIPVASGTLCLGGSIIRFQSPGQILQVDANGEFSLQIDTTALPAGVPTPILAGDTYNFTAWFRDIDPMIGNTANFSNGLEVTFQ